MTEKEADLSIRHFEDVVRTILKMQESNDGKIFVIARMRNGKQFDNIVRFSTEGEKDREHLKDVFKKEYAWQSDDMGVLESSCNLYEITIKKIMDSNGREK